MWGLIRDVLDTHHEPQKMKELLREAEEEELGEFKKEGPGEQLSVAATLPSLPFLVQFPDEEGDDKLDSGHEREDGFQKSTPPCLQEDALEKEKEN